MYNYVPVHFRVEAMAVDTVCIPIKFNNTVCKNQDVLFIGTGMYIRTHNSFTYLTRLLGIVSGGVILK